LYIRVNPLRTKAADLLKEFANADIPAELAPGEPPGPEMVRVAGPHAVTQLPGFDAGRFVVQDLSAARVVAALDPQPGWSILDLCAAPGTKTTQLAEITQDVGRIQATDIDPKRLARVRENITRLGLASVTVVPYEQLEQDRSQGFDAILLDVPCSNSGVLARRIEARFRITSKAVAGLARTQASLLEKAAGLLKPGGRIAYSTCSIQRQENEDVVRRFLADHPAFELLHEDLLLPEPEGFDHDGGYVAILSRR
jgi:16S rRNA (cytosine967-C5)-methyltransferase